MSQFSLVSGSLGTALEQTHQMLDQFPFHDALWGRRVDLWTQDPEVQGKIANRLGWLRALDVVLPGLERLRACARAVQADGFTDIVLLGMGGSSLAPEVMRQVLGVQPGCPRFRMLDSVDPDAVDDALGHVEHTLFVFASKSGGTIEPNAMAAEAARRLSAAGVSPWGSRFIAITDEGTALHRRAVAEGFRDIFVNPSDIGGRFSALSFFGLVPAALMGVDLDAFVARAQQMVTACQAAGEANPGRTLGAFMAAANRQGRDKLTLLLPDRLASLGLWIEQLVAESTGKHGVGVVPIAGERPGVTFGADRAAVIVHMGEESPDPRLLAEVQRSGVPAISWRIDGPLDLGAEFFRWEVATAAAGLALSVNPFDEPNVQQAKDATNVLLSAFASTRSLPTPAAELEVDGCRLSLSSAARRESADPAGILRLARPGDYVSVMAFLPPDDATLAPALASLREQVGRHTGLATMFGYGPRYLHSTGQLHKGGAANGVFVVLTAPPATDFPVPDAGYSFGTLLQAQALGDFASLEQTGRRAVLVQLPARTPGAIEGLTRLLTGSTA